MNDIKDCVRLWPSPSITNQIRSVEKNMNFHNDWWISSFAPIYFILDTQHDHLHPATDCIVKKKQMSGYPLYMRPTQIKNIALAFLAIFS